MPETNQQRHKIKIISKISSTYKKQNFFLKLHQLIIIEIKKKVKKINLQEKKNKNWNG